MTKKNNKNFIENCCNEDTCMCDYHSDNSDDDYMLERLYDMRNDIDFMIRVLEHRKDKEQACQNILAYEDDDEECNCNECYENLHKIMNDLLDEMREQSSTPYYPKKTIREFYPFTINNQYPYTRVYYK